MIANANSFSVSTKPRLSAATDDWRARFTAILPAICRHAEIYFRRLSKESRKEAIQESVAAAFLAYVRLVKAGKEELAYATPLANYAVRFTRSGRTIGGSANVNDVSSSWCQRRRGIRVESLQQSDKDQHDWRELLVDDRRATPAELATTKIDFQAWLGHLPCQHRAIAELLASGETTKRAAERFGLTPGRVSQLRRQLHQNWRQLHEEPSPT
jgi:hypothetical protein